MIIFSRQTLLRSIISTMFICTALLKIHSQSDSSIANLFSDQLTISEKVSGAFKSTQIVNNPSIEMIAKKNLDFRILHRFGFINSGIYNFFGLDQASMRLGFDYGILNNLSVGVGRSTYQKELDGHIKWRIIQQQHGVRFVPVSIVWQGGMVINTQRAPTGSNKPSFCDRCFYYHDLLVGRKLSNKVSLQLIGNLVHRNFVNSLNLLDKNNVFAAGVGGRIKVSNRVAFIVDYNYIITGVNKNIYKNPLGIGIDIETGGHVFQLHFSNSEGMNEKAYLTQTTRSWGKGEINFGFNLSRMFTTGKR